MNVTVSQAVGWGVTGVIASLLMPLPSPLLAQGNNDSAAGSRTVTSDRDARFASFDTLMAEFMDEHGVPGLSLAVGYRGKVVYTQGYGLADIEAGEPVTEASLFRIASLSKPVTAVAILRLAELGLLQLDDPVLNVLTHYEEWIAAHADSFDERWRSVTVRHLLQHRGGWDRDVSFDAMFKPVEFARETGTPPPATPDAVIRAMLKRPLDFEPGQRYAYSNFGYCLLGRVVETVTKESYQAWVTENVLQVVGAGQMRLGATRLPDRAEHEVRYYHRGTGKSVFADDLGGPVEHPYGAWHLEAMDAHGGWLASAGDLARFAVALDDRNASPLLSAESISEMYARPPGDAGYEDNDQPKPVFYSLGWLNRQLADGALNHWHTGSLPGTATILIRRHDGVTLVALMNTRQSESSQHLGRAIDQLLHRAANRVERWTDNP